MRDALKPLFFLLLFASQAGAIGIDVALAQENYAIGDVIAINGVVISDAPGEYNVSIRFVGEKTLAPPILVQTSAVGRFGYALETLPGDAGEYRLIVESMGKNREVSGVEKPILISETGNSNRFKLEFLLPANMEQFYHNDNITLKVRVLEGAMPVEDATVRCRFVFPKFIADSRFAEDRTITLEKVGAFFTEKYKVDLLDIASGGIYLENYQIQKTDPTPFWVVKCYASRNGYSGGVSRIVKVAASPIKLEVISPKGGVSESADIIIRARYQNDDPATGLFIVVQDSENNSAALAETSKGIYASRGYAINTLNDYWSFIAVATDQGQNVGKASAIFVVERTDWAAVLWRIWWIIPLLAGLAMLLKYLQEETDAIYRRSTPERAKALLKELDKLKKERKQVQISKEIVEKKYYRRLIDSETFKRMMEDYERRTINLDVEINGCEDALGELKKQ